MQIVGPAPEAMSNEEVIAKFDSAITAIIKASADPQFDSERQLQINQARLLWLFVKNNHFAVPGDMLTEYGNTITDFVPFDYGNGEQQNGADIKLCPPMNFMGGDLYKFMALMGKNAPRVKAVADDPQDPESEHAGHVAEINVRDLWVKQQIDRKWKVIPFHLYVTGPAFIRTYWNTDRRKYGESVEPKIEIETGEDGLPMPVEAGNNSYANGDAEIDIHSIIDVAIPYQTKDLSECPILRLERMRSKWSLLKKYAGTDEEPGPLHAYREADLPDDEFTSADTTANQTREAVVNPSGTGKSQRQNFWRFVEYWIEPDQYEAAPKEAREVFRAQYPDGMYVARAGSKTCEIDNRKCTDEWAVCKVGRGENIMDRPIAADTLPISRAIDDLVGMTLETALRAITQTVADSQYIDRHAMSTKEATPSEMILTTMPVDGNLANHFFQIPPARVSDQLRPFIEDLRKAIQDITGIRPELSGGGPPTQTYREAKQRKDQALQQLSPQADEMNFAATAVAENLVKLRAKYGAGTVKVQRKSSYGAHTDTADIAELREGGWHVEGDDLFPMSVADRRDAIWGALKEFPPEVQQALSLLSPLNIEETSELIQIPGYESAMLEQKEKTLHDINVLLAQQATDGPAGPDGAPGPKQPSLPPDSYDDHGLVAQIMGGWLVGNFKQKDSNPAGYENVAARHAAEVTLSMPPPPPPPPPLRGSVTWNGKLEDFPNLVPQILEGEGLKAPPPSPPSPPAPGAGPADLGAPPPVGGAPKEAPIPPPPPGPGAAPASVQ